MDGTRRDFLRGLARGGAGLAVLATQGRVPWAAAAEPPSAGDVPPSAELSWLDGAPPQTPAGVSWGVPWARGTVARDVQMVVRDRTGAAVPTQTWPLAFWPDGSLKWCGVAIAADARLDGPLRIAAGATPTLTQPLRVREDAAAVEIATGPLTCRIARHGANLIESLSVDGREVGRALRLVASREDRSALASQGVLRVLDYVSRVTAVTVEQAGPLRAVVRIAGVHAGADRAWLPFTVRLYFTAGLTSLRVVHSVVFDGDAQQDFIRGLGITCTVPFREERQNRHARFATDDDGVWAEPVLMAPGYREVLVKGALQMNRDQLQGRRIPNLAALDPKVQDGFAAVPVWDGFKLDQLAPDSFSIAKRTGAASSWLHHLNGRRARGLAFLGDVSGGLAVGVKDFWEKYPAALEIGGAAGAAGELTAWFWSPDAPAMDLRHYDTVGHEGKITYEDHQEGYSTPTGVANTQELTLWAAGETPDNTTLAAWAKSADVPPLLVCTPAHYHATRTLGIWSLPDRADPDAAVVEEQLDRAWNFYAGEIERRRWYGFWDFGDVMRTYSDVRHGWLYDIGGHAWNNTELMPNAWLWFAFLRSGRGDAFRLAAAMTRNTGEVDVYHSGPFMGLGSRHNVSHWGCGAKEARISEAWLKRCFYYLTTDERTGDLMREVLTVDETIARVQPLRHELTRPDEPVLYRIAPDWLAMASNWMTEWERTGDLRYRDFVLAGMKAIGAMPEAFATRQAFRLDPVTKQLTDVGEPNLKVGEFLVLFGGDQIMVELGELIPCPEFTAAWLGLCGRWVAEKRDFYSRMRVTAFLANAKRDPALKARAWQLMKDSLVVGGRARFLAAPVLITGPEVAEPVQEMPPPFDTPGVAQWALNVLTTMQLAKEFAP